MDAEDIESLVAAFEATTLDPGRWTHAAHLTVALYYVGQYGSAFAVDWMRRGIQRYHAAVGGPSAYDETITLAWMAIVARFHADHEGMALADAARVLVERYSASRQASIMA